MKRQARGRRGSVPSHPNLWQVMADLQEGNVSLREAYRTARALQRAARRTNRSR